MNTNGSGHRQLTSNALGSYTPAWSPNGKTIAFSRDDRIWLMNANGTNQRPLSQPPSYGSDEAPAWSPDGHSIAFVRALAQEEPESDIYVMNSDGTGQRRLTSVRGDHDHPDWQPVR